MERVNKFLNHLEEYFAVITLIIASLIIFFQVLLRKFFNISLIWSEETARYIIIWFILIGSSIAVREKAHAAVDAIVTLLPPVPKNIFSILANVTGIIFAVILTWSGYVTVYSVVSYGNTTPSIGMSMGIPYLAMPVGGFLMLFRFTQLLFNDIKRFKLISKERRLATKGEK